MYDTEYAMMIQNRGLSYSLKTPNRPAEPRTAVDVAVGDLLPRGAAPGRGIRISQNGRCLTIGFRGEAIGVDPAGLSPHRDELFRLIESPACDCVVFDLTGVRVVFSGFLGIISTARALGREVEVLNPSREVQEILRAVQFDSSLMIRGTSL